MDHELDTAVRCAAFQFLEDCERIHGDQIPYRVLQTGFVFRGTRVPLIGPQGIFKPAILRDIPLSFNTAPIVPGKPRPYEDDYGPDGLIRYRYRGRDPQHRDNVGMRMAMQRQVPLIYLFGTVEGKYLAEWPAYVVGDDPSSLTFQIALDDRKLTMGEPDVLADPMTMGRRIYVTATVQQRLHQRSFHERVMAAYKRSCAICRLRHRELLDAAHILPDKHPKGEPWVSNGISLCKLHHAAFDRHFIGIRPDLVVEVQAHLLQEKDGPMLVHGIQDCHHRPLMVLPSTPSNRPNPDFLRERYQVFQQAC